MERVEPGLGPFEINGVRVPPGERVTVDLPLSLLSTHTPVTLPVQVIHGRRPGPRLFVSAAIHGDEINGVEIIRRLLKHPACRRLCGTLIAIPIVNVYGFVGLNRYLPDRRDLNRIFPGSPTGPLGSQLAHLFLNEVVARCTHGVDLHTGAFHRTNLPQIRGDLSHPEVRRMALNFGTPVVLDASSRDGTLRQAAAETGVPVVLYEAGEPLRFDEISIRAGLKGVLRVMRELGMIAYKISDRKRAEPLISRSSAWTRSPAGGILRTLCRVGDHVRKGDEIGYVADPFGDAEEAVRAHNGGIVVGRTNLPVVNQGDALFHIARVDDVEVAAERVEGFQEDVKRDPLMDEAWLP